MIGRAMIDLPSPNRSERPAPVDMLILHYTGMQSAQAALDRLRDLEAKVSSHYVVDEDGAVYRLVPEEYRAFHAGVSSWRGRTGLNDVSIGVEIVNPGHEWGYRPFPEPQMSAVETLCRDIVTRHGIPSKRVLGHSDVAPDRKQDPGELFAWERLARAGIGYWPSAAAIAAAPRDLDIARGQKLLRAIGYDCPSTGVLDEATRTTLVAFQRHFRPGCVDGAFDGETAARLHACASR